MNFTINEVKYAVTNNLFIDVKPFFKSKNNPIDKKSGQPVEAGFVLKCDDGSLIVRYRGTMSMKEIKSDISIAHSEMNFGDKKVAIHSGFKKQFTLSQQQMQDAINELDPEGKCAITFTGHSIGAAIAQIAALNT